MSMGSEGDYSLCLGGAAFAGWSHFFSSLKLDRDALDVEFQGRSQLTANVVAEVFKLGPFQDDDRIHVDDGVAAAARQIACMGQKQQASGALPARVGIGKVHADIA